MKFLLVTVKDSSAASLSNVILGAGHQVELCTSGAEALQKAGDSYFDVVLLDMKLPEMKSFELICQIKETAPHINTIPLTNGVFREIITWSRRLGLAYFMIIQHEADGQKIIISSDLLAWKKS